jgi:hypothetical protein
MSRSAAWRFSSLWKLVDKRRDHLWLHQLVLQTIKDLGFQHVAPHGQ